MKSISIFSALLIAIVFFITSSLSSTTMALFTWVVGFFICFSIDSKNRGYAILLYNIIFCVTTLLILIRYSYLINIPDSSNIFKSGGDEHEHYQYVQDALSFKSWGDIFESTFFLEFVENQGYVFYIRAIGYIAKLLFDGNHIVLQMFGSSIIGCILSVIIYKILLLFYQSDRAYKLSVISFLFSPFLLYSISILRDIHIALVYALIILISLQPYTNKRLFWLFVLAVAAFFLRMENGIFALLFIAYYLFTKTKINKGLLIVPSVFFVIYIVSTPFFDEMYDIVNGTNEYYLNRSIEINTSGMTSAVETYPHPVRELAVFFIGNMVSPAGSWTDLFPINGFYLSLQALMRISYGCFWLFVFVLMLKWLFINNGWHMLNKSLKWIFVIAMCYEFANSTQMEVRRVMCVYPVFIVIFYELFDYFKHKQRFKQDVTLISVYYIVLSILIFIVKG